MWVFWMLAGSYATVIFVVAYGTVSDLTISRLLTAMFVGVVAFALVGTFLDKTKSIDLLFGSLAAGVLGGACLVVLSVALVWLLRKGLGLVKKSAEVLTLGRAAYQKKHRKHVRTA